MAIDRFLLAAVTDRLIYGSETMFGSHDARILLDALPHRKKSSWRFGIAGKLPGGTTRGYAAGVGSTKIEDEQGRTFEYATDQDHWTRAGQWKLLWFRKRGMQVVEIEQAMSHFDEEGRGARIHYATDSTPTGMDIRVERNFVLLNVTLAVPGWRKWKVPG